MLNNITKASIAISFAVFAVSCNRNNADLEEKLKRPFAHCEKRIQEIGNDETKERKRIEPSTIDLDNNIVDIVKTGSIVIFRLSSTSIDSDKYFVYGLDSHQIEIEFQHKKIRKMTSLSNCWQLIVCD